MAKGPSQEKLLEGYRVLDLADEKCVYCTKLPADLGADVTIVEAEFGAQRETSRPMVKWSPGAKTTS